MLHQIPEEPLLGVVAARAPRQNKSLEFAETVVLGNMAQFANPRFTLQRQLFARSERVKGIDFHPVEPWILTTLYSGMLAVHKGLELG